MDVCTYMNIFIHVYVSECQLVYLRLSVCVHLCLCVCLCTISISSGAMLVRGASNRSKFSKSHCSLLNLVSKIFLNLTFQSFCC